MVATRRAGGSQAQTEGASPGKAINSAEDQAMEDAEAHEEALVDAPVQDAPEPNTEEPPAAQPNANEEV